MVDLRSLAPERMRAIRRVEFEQMVEAGLFEDERIELLGGVIVEMTPPGTRHSEVIRRLMLALVVLEQAGRARISVQLPFALDDFSEPLPDLAVHPLADYSHEHPSHSLLVIEVSDSSLRKDRRIKVPLDASQGVREYWIVNLVDDVIEVHRDPRSDSYATLTTYGRGETVSPLEFPDLVLAVDEILPSP
jgi:Uma2 family endonuclease